MDWAQKIHTKDTTLTNNFEKVVNKHAPLKKKTIRGNDAPFMNKEIWKAIYTRTKLKTKLFLKNPSEQNELLLKKQRNICVSLRKKTIKNHLNKITEKGTTPNKDLWNFVKLFLTNKGFIESTDITLKLDNKIIIIIIIVIN